jgi:parvulin-like peptidyl-prolyl isomerase
LAKKNKKTEIKRPFTKHQLSQRERHKRQQLTLTIVGIAFVALILAFVGYGYYVEQFKPIHQKVLRVNDTVLDMGYYIEAIELVTKAQSSSSPTPTLIGDMTLDFLEQHELISQGAPELKIKVSDDEIDSLIKTTGLPDDKVTRDIVSAELLAKKMNDSYFNEKVPTTAEQTNVQAMLLESQDVAQEVINRLATGDNFTALASEFSVEPVTKAKSGELGWLTKGHLDVLSEGLTNSHLEQIAFSLEPGTTSKPIYDDSVTKGIGYWIIQVTEKDPNQGVHARGILVGTKQEAEEIRPKLEAGEGFAELAQKRSQDQASKDKGGDLGWLEWFQEGKGLGNDAVIHAAYQLELNALSSPVPDTSVKTQGGYWLVKVLDKDANRQIDEETRKTLISKLFLDWLDGQKKKSTIEKYLTEEQINLAVEKAAANIGK